MFATRAWCLMPLEHLLNLPRQWQLQVPTLGPKDIFIDSIMELDDIGGLS